MAIVVCLGETENAKKGVVEFVFIFYVTSNCTRNVKKEHIYLSRKGLA